MNGDQRIVVGVDGSEFSTTALRLAGRMSTALNIPLEVITCLGTSDFFLASHLPEDRTPTLDELEETAERLVDQHDAGPRALAVGTDEIAGQPARGVGAGEIDVGHDREPSSADPTRRATARRCRAA